MVEDPEPPSGKRSRLEDEVLEILYRSDRPPTFTERVQSSVRQTKRSFGRGRSGFFGDFIARMDSGLWLAGFVIFAVVAFIVKSSSPFLARILVIGCLILLALAIIRSFSRPNRGQVKSWRGRDIDFSPPTRPLWFDRKFRGPRRPPKR